MESQIKIEWWDLCILKVDISFYREKNLENTQQTVILIPDIKKEWAMLETLACYSVFIFVIQHFFF